MYYINRSLAALAMAKTIKKIKEIPTVTRQEFIRIVSLAKTNPELSRPDELESLIGLGRHKERRMVTEGGAIAFIRYQAMQFNGNWDYEELESLGFCFRRVDLIELSRDELKNHFCAISKTLMRGA